MVEEVAGEIEKNQNEIDKKITIQQTKSVV
jgi:hypothetical protein